MVATQLFRAGTPGLKGSEKCPFKNIMIDLKSRNVKVSDSKSDQSYLNSAAISQLATAELRKTAELRTARVEFGVETTSAKKKKPDPKPHTTNHNPQPQYLFL